MSRDADIRREVVDAMKVIAPYWVEITTPDGLRFSVHRMYRSGWWACRNEQWVAENGATITAPNARECCEHLWRAALRPAP